MVGRLASPLILVLAFTLAFLAGCSSAPQTTATGQQSLVELEQEAQKVEVEATDTTGVIRGLVVDAAIHPIAGANVTLTNPLMSTTTNEAGVFGFEELEPGTYFFKVTKAGYSEIQSSAEVIAGESSPDAVRVQMVAVVAATPFIETLKANIFVTWSGWVDGVGGVTVSSLTGEGNYFFSIGVTKNGTVAQTELVWEPTSPLGAEALSSGGTFDDGDAIQTDTFTGPSPLVMIANATKGNSSADTVSYNFYGWPSGGLPAGMHINQGADAFINVFHNFRPNEGWTFTNDGAHPLPP